ncbi:TonB-dependent receptor [Galbibacter sp. BG1]|uniref:TonB-dependent receptor n=1 Tax=Galbibacter sp. BG1 TaxID=1170699 RepID=UPI0015C1082A|nr:TonB-dependent receptor [Galbibacter sp. BG1]QLE02731.1 TonB-dependent receptor [Galbibacter sp. BG1]
MILRILVAFLFCACLKSYSQNVKFGGQITNEEGDPVVNANVLAITKYKDVPPKLGVTDDDGSFKLSLKSQTTYTVTVTHMGYETYSKVLIVKLQDVTYNIKLKAATNELEEVVINYTPPIEVKKDTTVYKVDAFTNGKERKLGAVLKKLPGVEVTRDGEVFFKNQKVSQVLVEDKTFFNGRTKMAVDNIPADVVNEIEMIEDYNETPFMKAVENSNELVMNVSLKEDKKKFLFGSIETAAGIEKAYKIHPSLFKYQPKLVYNVIADANNIYEKSFTLADYFSFEGETSPDRILRVLNSPITKFLQNNRYYSNNHLFGGVNFQFNPNEKNELRVFSLFLKDRSNSNITNRNVYQASGIEELRSQESLKKHDILLSKVKYKYSPDENTVLKLETNFEKTALKASDQNITNSENLNDQYNFDSDSENLTIAGKMEFEKWFSDKNISKGTLNLSYENVDLDQQWLSARNIFNPAIPVIDTSFFSVNGSERNEVVNLNFNLEHFYRPSRIELLTFSFNGNINRNNLSYFNFQEINNTSFSFPNFNNYFVNQVNVLNNSISYKRYFFGKLIIEGGLNYQYVFWNDNQINLRNSQIEHHILPDLNVEWEFKENKKVEFTYRQTRINPIPDLRLNSLKILDFNRIFRGDPYLDQMLTERFLLKLSLTKTYGWSYYANLGLRKHKHPITNVVEFNGINGINTPFQFNGNTNGYDAVLRLKYNRRYWKASFENAYYRNETLSVLNQAETKTISQSINNSLNFNTNLENAPNIDFSFKNMFIINDNPFFFNETNITELESAIEYDLNNWKFKASYFQTFYKNLTFGNNSNYNTINASVFYHKEDSLWEFGIDFYNLGNNVSEISNSYNETLFNEQRIRVFPRTIMLQVNYKL